MLELACGSTEPSAMVALSLAPNPIPYSRVGPHGAPGQPVPACCDTLHASWTLSATSSQAGEVLSAKVTLTDPETGATLVDSKPFPTDIRMPLSAGQAALVQMRLITDAGENYRPDSRLHMRLAVQVRAGTATDQQNVEADWVP
jgi:hypothetical protein